MADDSVSDDEYEESRLQLITNFEGGDLIQIQGQMIEIYTVTEEGAGLLFTLSDERQFIANDTRCMRRGRKLRPKKSLKPTSSLAPGEASAMLAKHKKKGKKRG